MRMTRKKRAAEAAAASAELAPSKEPTRRQFATAIRILEGKIREVPGDAATAAHCSAKIEELRARMAAL